MARFSEHNTDAIYLVANKMLTDCLLCDKSLLLDDQTQIWTDANIKTIHKVFTLAPDEGDRSFMAKFEDQIQPHGPEICQLAAELLIIYFLFPSSVTGDLKKQRVGEVLGWGGKTLAANSDVAVALSHGIGSGGQGYNTRRPFEIQFLIEFVLAWKSLSREEQERGANQPWEFMEIVDKVDGSDARQIRQMLLHVVFPDYFERIASRDHKRRVVFSFKTVLGDEATGQPDRDLYLIRQKLEGLLGRKDFDFYWHPLREVWFDDSEDSSESTAPMDALRHKKQVVFYGPPGTGKTFRARRVGDRLIRSALLSTLGPREYFELDKSGGVEAMIAKRIERLQLHPAYGYENFVVGLHLGVNGSTEYRLGYLPDLVQRMEAEAAADQRLANIPHILILDEINRTDLSRMLGECFTLLENRSEDIKLPARGPNQEQISLRLPPNLFVIGTMNLIDQSIEQMDFALRRRFLWLECPFSANDLLAASKERWDRASSRITWDRVAPDFGKLAMAATALNREIHRSPLLGGQYEIGHAYLLDVVAFLLEDLGERPLTFLWNRNGQAKKPVEQTWNLSLKPLINEYLSGLETKSREMEIARLSRAFLNVEKDAD